MSRNLNKTLAERRRKPERVSGVMLDDFGSILDLKKEAEITQNHIQNGTEKRRGPKTNSETILWILDHFRGPSWKSRPHDRVWPDPR